MNRKNVDQRIPDSEGAPQEGMQENTAAGNKKESKTGKAGTEKESHEGSSSRESSARKAPRPRIARKTDPEGGSTPGEGIRMPLPYNPADRQDADRPIRPVRQDAQESPRPYRPDRSSERPAYPRNAPSDYGSTPRRPYTPDRYGDRDSSRPPYDPNRYQGSDQPRRPYDPNREYRGPAGSDRPDRGNEYPSSRNYNRDGQSDGAPKRPWYEKKKVRKLKQKSHLPKPRPLGPGEMYAPPPHPEGIRINRYIANAGICSRREADRLIEAGEISVNGVVTTTLGSRIHPGDVVAHKGTPIQGEKLTYILLNKPKGFITTNDDPEGRNTVMELVAEACPERLFPVGRLDRNTTGLLLFTNDGIMAEKLMHPRNLVKKLYHIKLDRPLDKEHMQKIALGIKLEDGWIKADQISYVGTVEDHTEIGMEIHSGKNRIVRRIFEELEYEVVKLDRVMFAGLTKKDLRRGKWRHLTPEELNYLKML